MDADKRGEFGMNAAYRRAQSMQRMAADPVHSVFVSANAGSGKTKVLVERVSRILLNGTKPDKILCLTYTKAAASEMQTRLFEVLGDWSILPENQLEGILNELEGVQKKRSKKQIGRARRLFANALETPGGLKIQTLHAFCERVLRQFPLEAGLLPGSEAIDEAQARALQTESVKVLETEARSHEEGELANAISVLAFRKGDKDLQALYQWIMNNAYKIDAWEQAGGSAGIAKHLGVAKDVRVEKTIADIWAATSKKDAIRAAKEMQESTSKRDQARGQFVRDSFSMDDPETAFETYCRAFFSKSGKRDLFKVPATKSAGDFARTYFGSADKKNPSPEAQRLIAARETIRTAAQMELIAAFFTLAVRGVAAFRALKRNYRVMNFDDQIYLVRGLLCDGDAKDWVRYKLDGGVDHVLVDESQDTSDAQWQIVDAISEDFFQPSPDTDRRYPRTVFAVGDEKQSIYSFQGAEPELFLEQIQTLIKKQIITPEVNLQMSFRSAPQILKLVDQVFYAGRGGQAMFDSKVFPSVSDRGVHFAHRSDPGIVEFWPAAKKINTERDEKPWKPEPVDALQVSDPREQLARAIAARVKTWLANKTPVYDRKNKDGKPRSRSIRPEDIMILVTKRLPFFDALIRNLKEEGVPVAGADRLKLTDSIAVLDLLSLAKFCLLPEDDLSLAEVLKSPVFGWDDEQLFDIAHDRTGSLWQALPEGYERRTLKSLRGFSSRFAPYEFFARTLAYMQNGESLYQKFLGRLGSEITDVVDVFLSRALTHQRRGVPSLARFINEIKADENKIKREMGAGHNEVRVMTVHAAKGLEAPVVILPDTTTLPDTSKENIFSFASGFIPSVRSQNRPEFVRTCVQKRQQDLEREHMRLLYVALTRAESRLLICGYESHGKVVEKSWHDLVQRALSSIPECKACDTPFGEGIVFGLETKPARAGKGGEKKVRCPLPGWVRTHVPEEKNAVRRVSPSRLVGNSEPQLKDVVRSPLTKAGSPPGQFGRGNIIHKLLQFLPDIHPEKRRSAAQTFLQAQSLLDDALCKEIETEVFNVLDCPDFAHFFNPGSRAEVSLGGKASVLPDTIILNGQIDRLYVDEKNVWILDYKSNRPPPKNIDGISQIYIRQMAAYRALACDLYPDKKIICALLWTDGPRLMVLPDEKLDKVDWDTILAS